MIFENNDNGILNAYSQKKLGLNPEQKKLELIPVNKISLRFENKFIVKEETLKPLIKSIEENGLIEPIVVCRMEDYLVAKGLIDKGTPLDMFIPLSEKIDSAIQKNSNSKTANEISLLEKYKELADSGFEYFISSGHRRFKAYISILTGKTIVSDQDWENIYEEKLKNPSIKISADNYFRIPSYIVTEEELSGNKETSIYADSNTTQRELTSFEVVINVIDEMHKNNAWEEMNQTITKKIFEKYIPSEEENLQKNSTFNKWVKKLEKSFPAEYQKIVSEKLNGDKQIELINQKKFVLSRPADYMTGGKQEIAEYIADYIKKNKGREIKPQTVRSVRVLLETYSAEFMQYIYDGKLSIRDAKNGTAIYNKLKKFGELSNEEILIQIKNSSIQKRDKNIHTEKKTKDKIFKSTDVVKILKQIKSGELSIEDAIETFK